MNQRNSTNSIQLNSFQPEIRLGRVTGKASRKSDIDEIAFTQRHPDGQKIHV